ncbi:MAG: hypothetical protein A3A44_02175 [Candidatus Sungbacteria bacterium RIFCSPLOWO2_01_FULL_60_25]|uniref:Isopentenyl phosphate kinase n=1 Tax=Candidatus Sungbacteria bacterium RIFCSPLOWO2_01_FULL_60_25 TaxID=1802281 RepID=A0A1G2LB84_9BACT|nr:MAG: hypothetical protein A3A44_02175 [Candidatus Sungbacteria bacterium RIFCSPLOWO2_01_FULL_60_25]
MARTIILKLGGSIITNKRGGKPAVKTAHVHAIARVLADFRRKNPGASIILLHGGGSFGHPLAHRYRIAGKRLGRRNWRGIAATTNAMRELTTRLADIFLRANMPVMPLQTFAMVTLARGRVTFRNSGLIKTVLATGGIPLLGGDVAIADGTRSAIVSADTLAAAFARAIPGAPVLFATDVPGVFSHFPTTRDARPIPLLNRTTLRTIMRNATVAASRRDVTGGMAGKLLAVERLRGRRVMIFDGRNIPVFARALSGRRVGTTIQC